MLDFNWEYRKKNKPIKELLNYFLFQTMENNIMIQANDVVHTYSESMP